MVGEEEFETRIAEDLDMQRGWVEQMRPAASLLKFRLPFEGEPVPYFRGCIRLQPWAAPNSTETRLEVTGVEKIAYTPTTYESLLSYHNAITRVWRYFPHDITPQDVPGVDHCFDCALEVATWEAYLDGIGQPSTPAAVAKLMNQATELLSQGLDKAPHGVEPDTPMVCKRERLVQTCLDGGPCEARDAAAHRRAHKRLARRRQDTE